MTREEQISNGFTEMMKGFWGNQDLKVPDFEEPCKQEPCEDAVSRQAVLDGLASIAKVKAKSDAQKSLMGRVMFFVEQLTPVTPTHIETVTDFADKCRRCGRTAITRAENDEILNEALRLLINVTEEDGVTAEQANGMLKLMSFFFYKYHGLKKKPEWVENIEARMEESEEKK